MLKIIIEIWICAFGTIHDVVSLNLTIFVKLDLAHNNVIDMKVIITKDPEDSRVSHSSCSLFHGNIYQI